MLRIRLQRTGNKNNPTYRIVVADKRNAAKGKC
ncbi:30S ribosomal protein S16, partial [Candidatus Peregrinibacteria bacterium]|nr:30S ribosomal protein S16 [Candidatus Peregrinibacteria bacterium]